ncbi:RsmB/NOP family class I SAM-dependent RNA methyltransferase [Sphingomonas piscis]|uniref:RsmB/NOP family class I SAM-dependent RNA methyltransferase n=1 Tax=Sphingomonas piscis TaxID=2714943 RepID=A0A6G7YST4_9SPHN|nr:RsmB/NOP family class I SAM-dependent RNA methyltransferase [Sphingomonas piscis]QIK79794.1 RsmB/NOP family class I SAM-dependent RNA methyltransferase [Sphingomonas piscis]
MTPAARLQAAVEILDEVIASVRDNGAPADAIVTRYFKARRYAGSSDRRAVREVVFRAIRRSADCPSTGRSAILGLASEQPDLSALFGQPRGPEPLKAEEAIAAAGVVPDWLRDELSPLVTAEEQAALLDRAPLDLRVNALKGARDALLPEFVEGSATPLSPWGIRLPADTRIDDHPAFLGGAVEVQDEGSQLIALACAARDGERIVDLCAGAGGKSLALASAAPRAAILATDSNRARLGQLAPRAARAGAAIETMLLNPPRELDQMADWRGAADLVLVDAPCSGSGTWRRNPEGRWRLTPERLSRLIETQQRLLAIAAELVRPGGRIVYAVCSLLGREGPGQADAFLSRRSGWVGHDPLQGIGRADGPGRLLTPGHDGTDGFFIARFDSPC